MTDKPSSKGSLLVVFLTVFVDLLGFGMVLPLLPLYGDQFSQQYQMTDAQRGWTIGLLLSSFSAMQFLFLPVWGRLSDRFGRKPILIIGLAGSTFFYALFGLAAAWRSLALLFVSRIGAGIAGATISTAQAYIADTTTVERRASGMALIGAAFALGFTFGPLIAAAALLGSAGDLEGTGLAESPWPGYVASLFSGAALLTAIFLLPESRRVERQATPIPLFDRQELLAALKTPSIGWLLLASFIAVFSFANFESTLSLQIEQIVERESRLKEFTQVLYLFAFLGVTMAIAQGFLVRRLAARLTEGAMAVGGATLAVGAFVLLAWSARYDHLSWFVLAMILEVVGFAFVNPALQSLISRRSDPNRQGGILGIGQSCSSMARIAGPLVGIRLFHESPMTPFAMAAGFMALAAIVIIAAVRRGKDFANEPKLANH